MLDFLAASRRNIEANLVVYFRGGSSGLLETYRAEEPETEREKQRDRERSEKMEKSRNMFLLLI